MAWAGLGWLGLAMGVLIGGCRVDVDIKNDSLGTLEAQLSAAA